MVDGYGISSSNNVDVGTARYIDFNGKVKGINNILGEKYIDDARKTLPNNGVQGIIPPIIEMENNKEYFLVIQKGFQFITDSETVITAFDKAPRRSTPGKGYSA